MSTTLTILDQRLRDSVMHQLLADPQVDASLIGVSAQEGVVTLSGYVDSYVEKLAAERSARRYTAYGRSPTSSKSNWRPNASIPRSRAPPSRRSRTTPTFPLGIAVTVRNGFVTLSGIVEWMYQKIAAERAVKTCAASKASSTRLRSIRRSRRETWRSASSRRCTATPTSTRAAFTSTPTVTA